MLYKRRFQAVTRFNKRAAFQEGSFGAQLFVS